MRYLTFKEIENLNKKTKKWNVHTEAGNLLLGKISWYTGWRRYIYFPTSNTIYDPGCLKEITAFLEQETKKHYNK